MKFKKKYFSNILILILINVTLIYSIKNTKFSNKLRNRSHLKLSANQSPYISVTVDPHIVEAEDVGFRVVNIPVMRRPSVSTGVVTNGLAVVSHPHQEPIGIQAHPLANIQGRPYLPNSDPFNSVHMMSNQIAPSLPDPVVHLPDPAAPYLAIPIDHPDPLASIPIPIEHDIIPLGSRLINSAYDPDINDVAINLIPTQGKSNNLVSLRPKKKLLSLHQAHPVSNFFQWASTSGIRMKKLLVYEDKNTGKSTIKTGEEIHQHEKVLEVPNELFIYSNSQNLIKIRENVNNLTNSPSQNLKEFKSDIDQICMAIYVLDNRANSNKFIEFLYENTNFQSFPFFFNREESVIIKGSFFKSLVDVQKRLLAAEYKTLISNHILSEEVNKKDYIKARIIVMANSVKLIDTLTRQETIALVPVVGLFDHKERKNAFMQINQNNEVEVIAERNISTNDKIVLNVGSYNNYQNLIYFGYSKKNKNKIEITLKIDLPYSIDSKANNEVVLKADLNINKNLAIFRRIANNNMRQNNNKQRTYFSTPFDLENEVFALKLYKKSLEELIGNYQTSIQQDIDNFKTNENQNIINIVQVLIEEKKIILRHLNSNLIFLRIIQNEYVVDPSIPSINQVDGSVNNLNAIHAAPIIPVNPGYAVNSASMVHFLQLEQLNLNIQPVFLPCKESIFILNKINLKKYFDLIKKRFNLNYELNPGNDYTNGDNLVLSVDELDISDFEDLFAAPLESLVHNVPLAQAGILHPQNMVINNVAPLQTSGVLHSQNMALDHAAPLQSAAPIVTAGEVGGQSHVLPHRIEPGVLEHDSHQGSSYNQKDDLTNYISPKSNEQYDKENFKFTSEANSSEKHISNTSVHRHSDDSNFSATV